MNMKDYRIKTALTILLLMVLFPVVVMSLITGERGNRPITNKGWPVGSLKLANLDSRLGYWEGPPFGGGEYNFIYRCKDANEFNEALKIFNDINAPFLELYVHNGPEYSFWLKDINEILEKEDHRIDWTFTVWIAENWNSLYNNPGSFFDSENPNFRKPVAASRIDVYLGGGSIDWKDVKVPQNILVINKRPESISFDFAGKGLVSGNVFDLENSKPIEGAEVILSRNDKQQNSKDVINIKTDRNGFCQISNIELGYYEVRVQAEGYVSRKLESYNNGKPEYYQFKSGLARPLSVKGIVIDENDKPIKGIEVSANNIIGKDGFGYPCAERKSAVTDNEGRFEIRLLPEGSISIRCRGISLYLKNSIFERYRVPSEQIRLVMAGTGIVRGNVVDNNGKKPAGQVVLELVPEGEERLGKWAWSGFINENGTFDIRDIPVGKYVISPRPNPSLGNFKPETQIIIVESGKIYDVNVILEESKLKR